MATKRQKHEAAIAKRERWLAERRESGLKAQKEDREYRDNQKRKGAREQHDKKHSWKKIDRDCILCQDLLDSQNHWKKNQEVPSSG